MEKENRLLCRTEIIPSPLLCQLFGPLCTPPGSPPFLPPDAFHSCLGRPRLWTGSSRDLAHPIILWLSLKKVKLVINFQRSHTSYYYRGSSKGTEKGNCNTCLLYWSFTLRNRVPFWLAQTQLCLLWCHMTHVMGEMIMVRVNICSVVTTCQAQF